MSLVNKTASAIDDIVEDAERKIFKSQNFLESHYTKHGTEIQNALGKSSYSIEDYLDDANYIISEWNLCSRINGYARFVAGQKYGFVELDLTTGNITTYHIK